jgi:hypothetical protein
MRQLENTALPTRQSAPAAPLPQILKRITCPPPFLMGRIMAAPGKYSSILCPLLSLLWYRHGLMPVQNRECRVGYVKGGGQTCKACDAGKYKSIATTQESSTSTVCSTCTTCKSGGIEFQSSDCNTTKDRVCSACGIKCSPGQCIQVEICVFGTPS